MKGWISPCGAHTAKQDGVVEIMFPNLRLGQLQVKLL